MTAFKNTIAGRLLKGVGKVAAIGGAAAAVIGTGGALAGAIPVIAKGAGLFGKLFRGASKVSKAAVNLVTGTTAEERSQVQGVKQDAKAAQDKLDQLERLIRAGATRADAERMAGITHQELGSADAWEKDAAKATEIKLSELRQVSLDLPAAGGGCLVTLICLLSGLAAAAGTIALIFT